MTIHAHWNNKILQTYNSGLKLLYKFLQYANTPNKHGFPASDDLLASFVTYLSSYKHTSPSRVCSALAGVRAMHILHIAPWNTGILTSTAISGATRLYKTPKLPLHNKVTLDMLQHLHNGLTLNIPFDCAVWTAALVAFWCQCRLGELLSSSRTIFDPSLTPSAINYIPSSTAHHSATLTLPSTKTSQTQAVAVTVPRESLPFCPITTINSLLALNPPRKLSLFSYCDSDNMYYCLTKSAFLSKCNSILTPLGFKQITGHCFRIGGTTHLLLQKVDPKVVQLVGR